MTIKENRIYEAGQLSTHSFRNEAAMSYFFSLASLFAYHETKSDNYNDEYLGLINKKKMELKKSELNYLENYLNSLLKERTRLEEELSE